MPTSGSYDYSRTAGQIINAALRKLGISSEGEDPSAKQLTDAMEDLNLLVKSWPANGIDLWRYEELTVFTEADKLIYSIGATGDKASFNAFKTEIATAASSTDLTITVDSDDNITNGDVIGIELDDGTLQWTTVNGVPAADVVTITDALTDDVAVDNHVYNYTSIAQRPLRIYDGRVKLGSDSEIPLRQLSRSDYKDLPSKESTGTPTQYFYNPLLTNGKLTVWPVSDSVQHRLLFSAQRQLQDLDATTDNLDFPQEWLKAIIWNLAVDMAPDYNIPTIDPATYDRLEARAQKYLDDVEDFDIENVSFQFAPAYEDYGGGE